MHGFASLISTRYYYELCQGNNGVFISMQDTSRNGNVFQPPVSSLTVMCNSVSKHLTTTATEFTFTDAGCISATAANITLNISNEVGSVVASTRFPSSEFGFVCDLICEIGPLAIIVFAQYGPKVLRLKPTMDSVISALQCSTVSYLALTQVLPLCKAFMSHSIAPTQPTNNLSTRSRK